jgi:hypothetical protein
MLGLKARGLFSAATRAVVAALCLAACGSGGNNGSIQVVVDGVVPAERLIPANATSLVVSLTGGPTLAPAQTLTNFTPDGSATTTFTGLEAGTYMVSVLAQDAAAAVLALGSVDVRVTSGATTTASLSLTSSVVSAAATLTPGELADNTGATSTATLTCYAGGGQTVVPVAPSTLSWSSSNTAVATVSTNADGTGTVSLVAGAVPAGAASVQVTITGKYAEASTAGGGSAAASATATLTVDAATTGRTVSAGRMMSRTPAGR